MHVLVVISRQDVRNAVAAATSYNVLVSVVNPDPGEITVDPDIVRGDIFR